MENLDYPFSVNQGWKNGEEEGVRNGFFYILFPASMIKRFTVQDYKTWV